MVPVGYYFSFFVEFVTSGCAFTYTTGYIVIILIISALWLALTLLAWVAAIYINYKYVQ